MLFALRFYLLLSRGHRHSPAVFVSYISALFCFLFCSVVWLCPSHSLNRRRTSLPDTAPVTANLRVLTLEPNQNEVEKEKLQSADLGAIVLERRRVRWNR